MFYHPENADTHSSSGGVTFACFGFGVGARSIWTACSMATHVGMATWFGLRLSWLLRWSPRYHEGLPTRLALPRP